MQIPQEFGKVSGILVLSTCEEHRNPMPEKVLHETNGTGIGSLCEEGIE